LSERGNDPVLTPDRKGRRVFLLSKDGAMSNEQDEPYEEAGLIDHEDDEDEEDEDEVEDDEEGTAENPFVDQTQPPGRQETGVTERISEEIDKRIAQSGNEDER